MLPRRPPVLLAIGLTLIVIAILPAVIASNRLAAVDAYRAAPICSVAGQSGCRLQVATTIGDLSAGDFEKHQRLRIDQPASVAGSYQVRIDDNVVTGVAVGDPITAEVWRGRVVALTSSGGRTYTANVPFGAANRVLGLALVLALLGLSFLTKYALGARALDDRAQWRIDFRNWRSIAYNVILLVTVSAVGGWLVSIGSLNDDEGWGPVVWTVALFPLLAGAITLNTFYHARKRRRRTRSIGRMIGSASIIVLGTGLAVVSACAAISNSQDETRLRAAAQAAPCPIETTVNCLRNEVAVVEFADPSGDDPAVYIDESPLGARWVYFRADQKGFVASMSTGPAILTMWNSTIVSITPTGRWTGVAVDNRPFFPVSAVAAIGGLALVLLAVGIRWWRRAWRWRPLRVELPAGLLFAVSLLLLHRQVPAAAYATMLPLVLIVAPAFVAATRRRGTSAATPASRPVRLP